GPGAAFEDAAARVDHQVRIAPGAVPLPGRVEGVAGRRSIGDEAEPAIERGGRRFEVVVRAILELHRRRSSLTADPSGSAHSGAPTISMPTVPPARAAPLP